MRTVWKFPLLVTDSQAFHMPMGAVVLHVDVQRGEAMFWALVETDRPVEPRHFAVYGTGHPMANDGSTLVHCGSFLLNEGNLVFHLFEVLP